MWRVNVRNLGENSREPASVSTIWDEYCRNRDIPIVDNFVTNSQVKLLINAKIRAKIMELFVTHDHDIIVETFFFKYQI